MLRRPGEPGLRQLRGHNGVAGGEGDGQFEREGLVEDVGHGSGELVHGDSQRVPDLVRVQPHQFGGDGGAAEAVDGAGVVLAAVDVKARRRGEARGEVVPQNQCGQQVPARGPLLLGDGQRHRNRGPADMGGGLRVVLIFGADRLEVVGPHHHRVDHGRVVGRQADAVDQHP